MAEQHSYGTILAHDSNSDSTFTTVGYVKNIDGPSISVTATDTSDLSDAWSTFTPGRADGGEVTFEIGLDSATYDGLLNLVRVSPFPWRITLPNTKKINFDAMITTLGVAIPDDDEITAPVTLKVSGPVTHS